MLQAQTNRAMTRSTIDIGIDLGTTNSCIALLKGTEVEILRNNDGQEYTPSAVWLDRKDRLHVGQRAKEQYELDDENAAIEFKLQMGKSTERTFQRSSRAFKPEDLSAEVLKALLADARARLEEEIQAAVITVPAAFDLPQCDATRHAAQLAGLTSSPLLQEPVAAALAYGFQSDSDKVFWLVYDLGGGTFDAAVMQMRDGMFRVVNHGGDRHLGGKLIDWAIVEQLLVPRLTRERRLTDFRRGNPRWRAAFAKLKLAAEHAKIRVSREETVEIAIDPLCIDDKGDRVALDFELGKKELETLVEPFVLRSINICKKVLAEKRLGPGDIQKVLLVGGPTQTPYLRQRLAADLGIALESGIDPMTIVAKGAAIFAGTQRLDATVPIATAGEFAIQLEYQPVGTDPEPLVGGKVVPPPGTDVAGFTIEFLDPTAHPPRRSGRLTLTSAGTFMTNLWAHRGKVNTYEIDLLDAAGRKCPTRPDRFTYSFGASTSDPPLIHSLGIATINNEMEIFIAKGTALPARKRVVHRTGMVHRKGPDGDAIKIPLIEGENVRRADRNRHIGTLLIKPDHFKRDLPALSEIEITLEIDSSRMLRARAFIPVLDEEFSQIIRFQQTTPALDTLRESVQEELERLASMRSKANRLDDTRAQEILERIDKERIAEDLESALDAARSDPDAADKCQNRLLDLKMAVDEMEYSLELPALVNQMQHELAELRQVVDEMGTTQDKQRARLLENEAHEAIELGEVDPLWRKYKQVMREVDTLLWQKPTFLVHAHNVLEGLKDSMRDPKLAEHLFDRAQRALDDRDNPALRAALQQLVGLLPPEKRGRLTGYGGTTIN
jgi:molecular chaperone DnaK